MGRAVWLVWTGLGLLLVGVMINLGVAIYDLAIAGHSGRALLAITRAIMSSVGIVLLLVAISQISFHLRMYRGEVAFLKEWILTRELRRKAPETQKSARWGPAPAEAETGPHGPSSH